MTSGSVPRSAGKQFSAFTLQLALLHWFVHIYSILWRRSKRACDWWPPGHVKSDILFYSHRVMFQGESANTSRVSVLVSFSGSGESVTSLQYLMLVGCDLGSLIDKSLRTYFVLIRNWKEIHLAVENMGQITWLAVLVVLGIFVAHITMFSSFF